MLCPKRDMFSDVYTFIKINHTALSLHQQRWPHDLKLDQYYIYISNVLQFLHTITKKMMSLAHSSFQITFYFMCGGAVRRKTIFWNNNVDYYSRNLRHQPPYYKPYATNNREFCNIQHNQSKYSLIFIHGNRIA